MTPFPPNESLTALERPLYRQLLVMAALSLVIGWATASWAWGVSAAVGVLTAIAYYKLLAVQMHRQFGRRVMPSLLVLILSLAGRQFVCLAAPAACFFWLGQPWLVSLVTLVIARHWIYVVALGQNRTAALVPQV